MVSLLSNDNDDDVEDAENDDEDLAALVTPLSLHKDRATPSDRVVLAAQRALWMRVPPRSIHLYLCHRG